MVACRSACSAGKATLTTVPSINVIAEPSMVATRVQRFLRASVTRTKVPKDDAGCQLLVVALSGSESAGVQSGSTS